MQFKIAANALGNFKWGAPHGYYVQVYQDESFEQLIYGPIMPVLCGIVQCKM